MAGAGIALDRHGQVSFIAQINIQIQMLGLTDHKEKAWKVGRGKSTGRR